jgi:hypothetical protein
MDFSGLVPEGNNWTCVLFVNWIENVLKFHVVTLKHFKTIQMNSINIGTVIIKVLTLIIVRPLTLPLTLYKNALVRLSNSDSDESLESTLNNDFPLYVWLINLFDAFVALLYPVGIIALLIALTHGSQLFMGLFTVYLSPLYVGLIKELLSITLKTLYYLKRIADK